jgi:hypothetical protein
MDERQGHFTTGSVNVAAYLLTHGLTLARVQPVPLRAEFVFRDPTHRGPGLAAQYRTDEAINAFLRARTALIDLAQRAERTGQPVDAAEAQAALERPARPR